MVQQQTAMGFVITAMCVFGLLNSRWIFEKTRKGRRLAQWLGEVRGLQFVRGLLFVGILFGLLLAADVIRPIHWAKH
jgi:hypothetical protein